jgi:type I restriction enzyme S subunit
MQEEKQLIPQLRFSIFKDQWVKRRLNQVAEIITGNTPSTVIKEYYEGEKLFVSPADIQLNRYVTNTKTTLTCLGFSKGRKIKKNSVLFVSIGSTIGKVGQVKEEVITNQQINSLISKSGFSDDFIYSLLEKNGKNIKHLSGVQAVPLINKTDFSALKFNFPKQEEQQKIANFLTAIDNRIQTLEKKKSGLEQYKKGVMQKIFKQELRFKDEYGKAFPEWEEKKLGEVCSKKSSNISANKIGENFGEYIIYGASGVLKKVDFYKEENDYVSIIKDGAGVGRIVYCKGKSSVLGTMEIIKPNSKLNTYFLYCLLENVNFKKYITGSTIPHIYFKDYKKEKCNIPPLEEQTKIANFLSAIDINVELVTKKIEYTKTFKKGLLQQMFV